MKHLRLAIGFLTVLPVSPGAAERMGPARAYFPLVGLGLGGVLAGLDFAAGQVLPPYVVGALLVAALLIFTRAIHTEGFLDCCDGLLGAHTPERRLQVLRDPHVGAFAVAGGAALLLLKWSLLTGVPNEVRAALLALFPCLSRFGMVTAMAAFTYVRASGAGTAFQAGAHWWQVVFGLATAAAAGALLLGVAGLLLLGAAIAVSLAVGWWVTRLLGGMTGDAYGAVNEVAEVTVLLLAIALLSPLRSLFEAPLW